LYQSAVLGLEKLSHKKLGHLEAKTDQIGFDELRQLYTEVSRVCSNDDLNEATARDFTRCVVCSVNSRLWKYDTWVGNETAVIGQKNHDKADLTIKSDKIILLVVESKVTRIDTAIIQNLLKLVTVCEQNLVNRIDNTHCIRNQSHTSVYRA
jgi:hypothetical protein